MQLTLTNWMVILILINFMILLFLITYWWIVKKYQQVDSIKTLIGTTFTYSWKSHQIYFEIAPWFFNQKRNSFYSVMRLMTKKSALKFTTLIDKLIKNKQPIGLNKPIILQIDFYILKKIEKCQIEIYQLKFTDQKLTGVMSNLYENTESISN